MVDTTINTAAATGVPHRKTRWRARRSLRPLAVALAVVALGGLVLAVSLAVFGRAERDLALTRLAQLSASLSSEIERFAHLPFVLASDGEVLAAARGAPPAGLNDRLASFAQRTGLEAIYVMDRSGLTTAASNHDQPSSFVGQRYEFRPYFREAMAGRTGTFFGVGATTRRPGYFVAMPVSDGGAIVGVVAAKLSLTALERAWADGSEAVYVSDRDGVVLLASDPTWRYRTLGPLDDGHLQAVRGSRQFAGASLRPFNTVTPDGSTVPPVEPRPFGRALHVSAGGLPNGWTLHYLSDDALARVKAWLSALAALGSAAALLLLAQHYRAARVRAALDVSVAKEQALRIANERLAVEIAERREAEHNLQRAEEDLRRASRLAVLGQLAASVSHELSQPIAAMRNHLTADELMRDRAGNGTSGGAGAGRSAKRLAALVDRMESTTRQLKFFGRPGDGIVTPIDLREIVPEAFALLEPNAEATGVAMVADLPDRPVRVRGNRLRLEQVLVNLARNGIDAMAEGVGGHLRVSLATKTDQAVLCIADEGPGLGDRTIDELSEPFVTTRASGEGMGLGLSISREIVREHGGTMTAYGGSEGGATFEVRLPIADAEAE